MIIFDDPAAVPYIGAALAIVCFAMQLLFCFKAKRSAVRRIPVYIILAAWCFVLVLCTGIFDKGVGFLGNIHLMVAAILAIVLGAASVGNAAAWIAYKFYMRKKKQ